MRPLLLITALLIVGGALAWEFIPIQCLIWDGSFDLTIHVSSPAGRLQAVSCQACGEREDAELLVKRLLPPRPDLWATVAEPFDGRPLTVAVPISGHTSPCGRELHRFQFRYLVVIARLQDGRRLGKLVDIPDGRLSREVSVSLP